MTRTAISPRLAIRIFCSTAANVGGWVEASSVRTWTGRWPSGWTVEHVAETGSTNADLLDGATRSTGSQRAGRRPPDRRTGRLDRTVGRPAGVEPAGVDAVPRRAAPIPGELVRRVSLAAVDAAAVARAWPATLRAEVAERRAARRRQAGRRARPAQRTTGAVVVGIGVNVGWARTARRSARRRRRPRRAARRAARRVRRPAGRCGRPAGALPGGAVHARPAGQGRDAVGHVVGTAIDVTVAGQLVVRGDDGRVTRSTSPTSRTSARRDASSRPAASAMSRSCDGLTSTTRPGR